MSSTPLNLMACVRESSPQEMAPTTDLSRHESKRRRFHPFRGLRRMFRRKARQTGSEMQDAPEDLAEESSALVLESHRSRSTSELLAGDEPTRRRSGTALFASHTGLSVSHDSVFTAEQRSSHSSCEDLDIGQSSSSLSIQQLVLPGVRAELFDAVRRRRGDTSEEDEDLGLPRSPCNSPTTADVLLENESKENATKSHSTCSDASLLSMGSSDMDEDSIGLNSGHSSKLSLHERKPYIDNDSELELGVSAAPLSHSAAKHKMAVRPKRTHGAPRRRKMQQLAAASPLPATPELNEESLACKNSSPDVKPDKSDELFASGGAAVCRSSPALKSDVIAAPLPKVLPAEVQQKSASLPHGPVLSQQDKAAKLGRSRSSASKSKVESRNYERSLSESEKVTTTSEQAAKINETFTVLGEEDEEKVEKAGDDDKKKDDSSFFGRLLLRKSGKKKREKVDETDHGEVSDEPDSVPEEVPVIPKRISGKDYYANDRISPYVPNVSSQYHGIKHFIPKVSTVKSTAASRQRVEPINIPASPESERRKENISPPLKNNTRGEILPAFDMSSRSSHISHSTSPPKPMWPSSVNKPTSEKNISQFDEKDSSPKTGSDDFKSKVVSSPIQQDKVPLVADVENEERECSSLVYTASEDVVNTRQSVKKAYSFREGIEYISSSSPRVENLAEKEETEVVESSVLKPVKECENYESHDEAENCRKESESRDVSSPVSSDGRKLSEGQKTDSLPVEQEVSLRSADAQGRLFTKHVSRNTLIKDSPYSNKYPDANILKGKGFKVSMKKSSSLDSINSWSADSPLSPVCSKKSLSSESISSSSTKELPEIYDSAVFQTVRRETESDVSDRLKINAQDTGSKELLYKTSISFTRVPQDKRASPTWSNVSANSPTNSDSSDVPEFLRVQLNRVDSKTSNVVLSTSVIFDSGKINSAKNKDDKSNPSSPEGIIKIQSNNSETCIIPVNENLENSAQSEVSPSDNILKDVVVKPKICSIKTGTSVEVSPESTCDDTLITQTKPVSNNPDTIERKLSQNAPEKKTSVVSITADNSSLVKPEVKPLTSEEVRKKLKNQISTEFKDIRIIEKSPTQEEPKSTRISLPARKHSINEKGVRIENKRQSLQHEFSNVTEQPNSIEVSMLRKPVLKEFVPKQEENKSAQTEKETSNANDTVSYTNVVLRKKSLPKEVEKPKEEEPELLKVFARRSLKLKDVDSESLSQQIAAKTQENNSIDQDSTKSRDSDKENECIDSSSEEKKKQFNKEISSESKYEQNETINEMSTTTSRNNNFNISNKYHRSQSNNSDNTSENETNIINRKDGATSPEKQRNITTPELVKCDTVPNNNNEKNTKKLWGNNWKERSNELTNGENIRNSKNEMNIYNDKEVKPKDPVLSSVVTSDEKEEPAVPHFKKIQQRREEWEKRAQQASKRIYS